MKFDFNSILSKIKENKKMTILIAVVIVIVIILLAKGGGTASPGFFTNYNNLHESSYTADGTIQIGNKDLKLNMNKSETDYIISLSDEDIDYSNLITKTGNLIYLNNEKVEENGGLLTINKVEAEDAMPIYDVLFNTISNSSFVNATEEDNITKIEVKTTEQWKGFFDELKTALTDNSAAIIAGYQNKEELTNTLNSIISELTKWSETETIANAFEAELITNESNTELTFSLTIDLSLLPNWANSEDIDSNKFKLVGDIIFTPTSGTELKKPTGAIHAATSIGIKSFASGCWDKLFEKAEYISFVDLNVTNNSVTAKYNLGNTTEELLLIFDNNGVASAGWTITSSEEDILNDYIERFRNEFNEKDMDIIPISEGEYKLSFSVSPSGINSYNKMARTPSAMADYLNSSKGGDIIV